MPLAATIRANSEVFQCIRRERAVLRLIGFVLAAGLMCAGAILLTLELFVAHSNGKLIMGGSLTLIGGAWLWSDYIGPMFGRGGNL